MSPSQGQTPSGNMLNEEYEKWFGDCAMHLIQLIQQFGLLPTIDQRMKGCGWISSWKK